MKRELEKARANHAREIEALENRLVDAKARLEAAAAETEEAQEVANSDKRELESTLAELRRRVLEEEGVLKEARETARNMQETQARKEDDRLRSELMRVVSELDDERKHNAELEGHLKEAKNIAMLPALPLADESNHAENDNRGRETGVIEKLALLEDKLAFTLRENEDLRKEATRAAAFGDGGRRGDGCAQNSESKAQRQNCDEFVGLKRALQEAEVRLSELQDAKGLAEQVNDSFLTVNDAGGKRPAFARSVFHIVVPSELIPPMLTLQLLKPREEHNQVIKPYSRT